MTVNTGPATGENSPEITDTTSGTAITTRGTTDDSLSEDLVGGVACTSLTRDEGETALTK